MTSSKQPYHSAIGKYQPQAKNESINPAFFPYGEVHCYDISNGWPEFMEKVDILYSELPWRDGYDKFHKRSGITPLFKYSEFLGYLGTIIMTIGKPAVMISGNHARPYLSHHDESIPVKMDRFNNYEARAYLWNVVPGLFGEDPTLLDVINALASEYNCIGDMCCGYGRAGRIFAEHGNRFVLSDISADCVGYITENAVSWGPHENIG